MVSLRIALAQIDSTLGDLPGNQNKIAAFSERARDYGADIVVFPELSLCGYPPEDLLLKPNFIRKNSDALDQLAARVSSPAVVIGCPSGSRS